MMKPIFLCSSVFCLLATSHIANAQSSTTGLAAAEWSERARAYSSLEVRTPAILLRQLQRENKTIAATLRESNSERGVSQKYGEEYGEYYHEVLTACKQSCDRSDPATIRALASGAYSASSPLARELAERHGPEVLQLMLKRSRSDIMAHRHDAIRMLETTGLLNRNLSRNERALLHNAVVDGMGDPNVAVRLVAITALGSVGSSADVTTLERIASGRVTLRGGTIATASPPESHAAREAIARVGRQ